MCWRTASIQYYLKLSYCIELGISQDLQDSEFYAMTELPIKVSEQHTPLQFRWIVRVYDAFMLSDLTLHVSICRMLPDSLPSILLMRSPGTAPPLLTFYADWQWPGQFIRYQRRQRVLVLRLECRLACTSLQEPRCMFISAHVDSLQDSSPIYASHL